MFAGTANHVRLVPRERAQGGVGLTRLGLVGHGVAHPGFRQHGNGFLQIADAQAFGAVQRRLVRFVYLEQHTPHRLVAVRAGEHYVALAGAVAAAFVPQAPVVWQPADAHRARRRRPPAQTRRGHVGAIGEVEEARHKRNLHYVFAPSARCGCCAGRCPEGLCLRSPNRRHAHATLEGETPCC